MVATGFLEALLAPRESSTPFDWLKARRAQALERASVLSVPTTREEEWRFTDLSALYRLKLNSAPQGEVDPAVLRTFAYPEAAARLVFVDGRYDSAASRVLERDGMYVSELSHTKGSGVPALQRHLTSIAVFDNDVFAAANTAFLQEAAVVHIAAGRGEDTPIHVLHVATGRETAAHPRVLIMAEQGAHCTVIEDFVSVGGTAYLTNAVTEIVVAPNAEVRHVKVQREAETAFHIANTSVRLERDSRYRNWSMAFGARISRHNLNVFQAGTGVDCEIDGLAVVSGRQLADTHSVMDHVSPRGRSRQLHKTIAGGSAHAVFNGRIMVRPGAQQTNSTQESRNLLLSARAHVDAKPELEIFADDVKCAHGATVGQIDAEEVFYLKSRGLSEAIARNLLTYAFAAEIIERIPVKSLVSVLESQILERTRNRDA